MRVAALFVETGGIYFDRPDVDPWDEQRDARRYAGPWPVVAHPPCQRWGNFWWSARHIGQGLGDDDGCFAAAVGIVRQFGGVLEHPAGSRAWARFGLPRPRHGDGWTRHLFDEGWSCSVDQAAYGHRAQKRTWLYYVGEPPPPLDWSDVRGTAYACWGPTSALTPVEVMGKRERLATPPPFAELLLKLARSSRSAECGFCDDSGAFCGVCLPF